MQKRDNSFDAIKSIEMMKDIFEALLKKYHDFAFLKKQIIVSGGAIC